MTYFSRLKLGHCKLIPVLLIIEASATIPWRQLSKLALTVTKQLCYLKIYLKDKLEHLIKGDCDAKGGSFNAGGFGVEDLNRKREPKQSTLCMPSSVVVWMLQTRSSYSNAVSQFVLAVTLSELLGI